MRLCLACLLYISTFVFGLPARPPESGIKHGRPPETGIKHGRPPESAVKRGRTLQHPAHDTSEIHRSDIAQNQRTFVSNSSLVTPLAPYEVSISTHDNTNQTSLQIKALVSAQGDKDSIADDESHRQHKQYGKSAVPVLMDNGTSGITSVLVSNDPHPLQHAGSAHEFPTGLQFLKTGSIRERNASTPELRKSNNFSPAKGSSLDIYLSESDANDSPVLSSFKNMQFDSPTTMLLDLQSLLGEVGPTPIHYHHQHQNTTDIFRNHENRHGDYHRTAHAHDDYPHDEISPHYDHIHSHHANIKANVKNKLSKLLKGFTPGLLEEDDQHQHDFAVIPTTKAIGRGVTNHIGPITKRDVQELDSISKIPNTFINNFLKVRIWNTTFPTTTPSDVPSQHTHDKEVSSLHAEHGTQSSAEQQSDSHSTKNASPNDVPIGKTDEKQVLHSDLIHLEGIHVMFSNGQPDATGNFPTIHLTARASNTLKDVLGGPKTQRRDSADVKALPGNVTDANFEKIVGTTIVKNGHLYLIVYPFGGTKWVDLHFRHPANNRISDPHARDTIPLPSHGSHTVNNIQHSTTTTPSPLINISSKSPSSFQKQFIARSSTAHTAHQRENDHRHHRHHPVHHQHGTSKQHDHDTRLRTINEKNETIHLSPSRVLSPWRFLNFSKVTPFVSKQRQGDPEDNENKIVKVVANATDPFEKVVSILHKLANRTYVNQLNSSVFHSKFGNMSTGNTIFNFEIKLRRDFKSNANVGKQPVQAANKNSSEEHVHEISANANNNQLNLNISGREGADSVMEYTKTDDALFQEYTKNDDSASGETPLSTLTTINSSSTKTDNNNAYESVTRAVGNTKVRTPTTSNNRIIFKTQSNIDAKDQIPDRIHLDKSLSENIVNLTVSPQDFSMSTWLPKSTFNSHSNYSAHTGGFKTTDGAVKMSTSADNLNGRDIISDTLPIQLPVNSDRPASVQRIVPPSYILGRGQAEQIISLSDIFNDIIRIQLHNTRRFNIHNNNFNTMILGATHEKRNHLLTSAITPMNTLPPVEITPPHHVTTGSPNVQRKLNRQTELNAALEAILVLSVDEILADHAILHGAMPRRSDSSNSNK